MMKGFLFGAFMGTVASVFVLGAASLVAMQPAGNLPPRPPSTDLPEAVSGTETGGLDLAPAGPDVAPAALDRGLGEPAPPVSGDLAGPVPGIGDAALPADLPQTADVDASPEVPSVGAAPAIASSADAPLQPVLPGTAPAQPMSESDLDLSTEPAQPRPPEPVGTALEPGPDAEAPAPAPEDVAALEEMLETLADGTEASPAGAEDAPLPDAADAVGEGPGTATPAEAADAGLSDAVTPAADDVAMAGSGEVTPAEAAAPGVEDGESGTTDAEDAAVLPGSTDAATGSPEDRSPEDLPTPGAPADAAPEAPASPDDIEVAAPPEQPVETLPGEESEVAAADPVALPGGETGVVIRRPEADPAAAPADPAPAPEEVDPDAPPLVRHAAAFERPEGMPLLSIVLIDDGTLDGAVDAVAALGLPVTVALDPAGPDAEGRMAAYRARGIEVAARPELPAGARPGDVEVTLEAGFGALGETVALVDPTGAWQAGGGVAEQTVARLAEEGRGLLILASGLGSALRLAEARDVPAAAIYRDLDDQGQDARVIRRFLDQAAFRARQDGAVVLLGRVRPDTLSALTLWGTANRAGQVAIAPLSAVLLSD